MPDHTITLLLGLVFSCINPLVPAAAALYYLLVTLIERYQQLYVWSRPYESGGQLWKQIVGQVCMSQASHTQASNKHACGSKAASVLSMWSVY